MEGNISNKWKKAFDTLQMEHNQLKEMSSFKLRYLDILLKQLRTAARGVDPKFDATVNVLVKQACEPRIDQTFPVKVEAFAHKVAEIDQLKINNTQETISNLEKLLINLQEALSDKDQSKKIGRLIKQLKKEKNTIDCIYRLNIPYWLESVSPYCESLSKQVEVTETAIKTDASNELSIEEVSQEEPSKGFFSKLFKREKNTDNQNFEKADIENSKNISNEIVDFEINFEDLDVAVYIDQLKKIVNEIEIPSEAQTKKAMLEVRLNEVRDFTSFVDCLENLIDIFDDIAKKHDSEFKHFLNNLDRKLYVFNHTLGRFSQECLSFKDESQELETKINASMGGIRQSVEEFINIDLLKDSVLSGMEAISDYLSTYNLNHQARIAELEAKLEEMSTHSHALEHEIENAKEEIATQREIALQDALTQLPNRKAYDLRIDDEYKRWKRYGNSLVMVIADIDFFKSINDNYGHAAGDKVLKLIARTMKINLRDSDFVGRIGGEEFVFLLTETDMDSACLAIEKVRKAIESCPFNFKKEPLTITCSFGMSLFCEGDTIEEVFERTDKALYEAKDAGRNCYRIARVDLENDKDENTG